MLRRLPPAARSCTDILKGLAGLYLDRGNIYRDLRDFQARDRECNEGLAISAQLAARFPDDEEILHLNSTALFGIAKGRAAEDPDEARQLFVRTLAIDERQLEAHPTKYLRDRLALADRNDAQIRLHVFTAANITAGVLAKMGRLEAGLTEYRDAARGAERAVAGVPADPRNREILGEIELGIGSMEAGLHHRRDSCDACARAAKMFEELVQRGIATPEERILADKAAQAVAACQQL